MLPYGFYEQVINKQLATELAKVPEECKALEPIDTAKASKVLSQYLANIIKRGLDDVQDIPAQIKLSNQIIALIQSATKEADYAGLMVDPSAQQLFTLLQRTDPRMVNNTAADLSRPESSIAQSSLFTGDVKREPSLEAEFSREIASADRIDMLVSFITRRGQISLMDDLRNFTENGHKLRIITTTYIGATSAEAVQDLCKLPNTQVKVIYDTQNTRLHAKAYIFHRNTGFTTAYVGSSNLSKPALTSGLEWNTKMTEHDLPEIIHKITATFESYWNQERSELYTDTEEQREQLSLALREAALKPGKHSGTDHTQYSVMHFSPHDYQKEILDKLKAEREIRGHKRNLIVAATGTGKTAIAAFDYQRFRAHMQSEGKPCRLLFVAHRAEILKQGLQAFRDVLRDNSFGELFVGSDKNNKSPESFNHLFITIQTFNSQSFTEKTDPHYYDYIVVDEIHHAVAPSYQKLLSYYKPSILLGLTATPERMDGQNILEYFDNRIAAEIRLPQAIDEGLLCPFQYYGITDTVDLHTLKWRGGYDKGQLSKVYTQSGAAERRAENIVLALQKYIEDIDKVKGLGFCVSIAHAEFMCRYFNSCNIPSKVLTGKSSDEERNSVKQLLVSGEVRFIFVVDLYNEGVDIPEINTILFLRPTESLTVFLQQLGRGLRLTDDPEKYLTVLDFIGQAHKKYNFNDKLTALLSNTKRSVADAIKSKPASAPAKLSPVPRGCSIQLERQAAKYVLQNISASFNNTSRLKAWVKSFTEDSGLELTLANFLNYYHLDPRAIYRVKASSFSQLCVKAKVKKDFKEPLADILSRGFGRFSVADSPRWISFLVDILPRLDDVNFNALTDAKKRMLQMFYVTIWDKAIDNWDSEEVQKNIRALSESPVLRGELMELLRYRLEQIDLVGDPVDLGFDCPLELHCTYTQDQLLVAMDFMNLAAVREGVKWLEDKKIDLLFVTLNKSDKHYSTSTMYNDYSISENLFHWQSQSTRSEDKPTGQRYIHHAENGSKVLLFVRESRFDRFTGKAAAYTYLGPANYVEHTGSRPMNIIWRLEHPIPAKLLKETSIS